MTASQIAAACDLIESVGGTPSVRTVCDVLKAAGGKAARFATVSAVVKRWALGEFRIGQQLGNSREHPGNSFKHDGQHPGNTAADTRAANEYLDLGFEQVQSVTVATQPVSVFPEAPKARKVQQMGMLSVVAGQPVARAEHAQTSAILDGFWPLVEPSLRANGKATMTKTEWKTRSKRIALGWVQKGWTFAELLPIYQALCAKRGFTVYSMRMLDEELVKNGASRANGTAHVDSCGCELPPHVTMPRLQQNETAHWDGEEFIFGDVGDPRARRA